MSSSKHRPTLQQGLDREVYQVVRKFLDDRDESPLKVRSSTIHDWVKNSNSSLKRRPKKQLEDSIERVLALFQAECSMEEETPSNQSERIVVQEESFDPGFMNRQITTGWAASSSKKRKRDMKETPNNTATSQAQLSLEDLGGVDDVLKQLGGHLIMPLLDSQEYVKRHLPIPRGILLHGPPGCGKTAVCKAFAAKLGVPFIEMPAPSIVSSMSGDSEKLIREHFERAKEQAPSLLFIDEIDVIAPKRDTAQSQMEKRIVAQLNISMDGLSLEEINSKPVIVLATTNLPHSLDPALRRGGRFDTEINMGVPNEMMRESILKALTRKPTLGDDVDFKRLAKMTAGFVGADLRDLVGKAGTWSMDQYREALEKQAAEAESGMDVDHTQTDVIRSIDRLVKRIRDESMPRPAGFEDQAIKMEAFEAALPTIIPSSKREGFTTTPDVTWQDVGALENVREELEMAIVEPIKNPQRFKDFGLTSPTGVLLWGPPGCGKTLLAKAVAAEAKANFISVKGPELLNKYVGESERAVRQVFMRARSSIPCVIFFDEFDALVPHRGGDTSESSARVVNMMLAELDGLESREGIYVIAATNRPDILDAAMLRPGRLETLLYVELPKPDERVKILKALLQKTPKINPNLAEVARQEVCNNFSGADLGALLRRALVQCVREGRPAIDTIDLEVAASTIRPSVGNVEVYEKLRRKYETKLW